MIKDMTNLVRKISDLKFAIGELDLPLYGFRQPHFHIMGVSPTFADMVKGTAMMDNTGAAIGLAKAGNALQNLIDPEYVPTGLINSHIPPQVLFYWNLLKVSGLWTVTVPRINFLRSYHFFGVQPQRFKGFTYHIDAKINTEPDSMMRHIVTPYEYILYNMPVHAVCDGEVTEVVMTHDDDIHTNKTLRFGSFNVEEHLGNIIRLRLNHVIEITYGGLQKNSTKLKPGDTVRKGDTIAKVGASAFSRIPFLYMGFSYVGPKLPIAGNLSAAFKSEEIPFVPHMQCNLINLRRLGSVQTAGEKAYDIFTRVDPMAIQYQANQKFFTPCCLIKKFPTIMSP